MKKLLGVAAMLLLAASVSHAQTSGTDHTTLTVAVGSEAAITLGTTSPFSSVGIFGDYVTSTPFTYFIRTGTTTGSGTITLQVTSDFAPLGGPSVGSPKTAGDALNYTCTVQSPGTACTGTVAAALTTTNVATFGANAQSARGGNATNSVAWTLTNDPAYAQGSYSATVTFTISAS